MIKRLSKFSNSILFLLAAGCASIDFDYPKSDTSAFTDTGDTELGRAFADSVAKHPGVAGFLPLMDGVEALALHLLLATFAIELGKELFSIYITQISPLQPVYGSVSTVIATLIWLYFSARVLLYGGELIAVLRIRRDPGLSSGEDEKDEKTDSP